MHVWNAKSETTVSSQAPIGWRRAAAALMPFAHQTRGERRPMAPNARAMISSGGTSPANVTKLGSEAHRRTPPAPSRVAMVRLRTFSRFAATTADCYASSDTNLLQENPLKCVVNAAL
jgi:hypothetical protein